jgi:hypothetical protein
MRNKSERAAARVLSEMYRERDVGKESRPLAPSREPLRGENDDAGRRTSNEPDQGESP